MALLGLGGACRDEGVRISFRPAPGTTASYELTVRSEIVTTLDTTSTDRDEVTLQAVHEVVEAGEGGSRVQVRLTDAAGGGAPRTFVVHLDRGAQLSEVQEVEGVPTAVLGELSLSEIFPAAAGAPPDDVLRPGQRWRIDEPLRLPGLEPSRLTGRGRLVELGVDGDRELATVATDVDLPVRRRTETPGGVVRLAGTQHTTATTVYDLADGSVQAATSVTEATFTLVATPPADAPGSPVRGTLKVEVRSTTRRTG